MNGSGPLDGVTILDLTRLLPGAFGTSLLADLGADVVKVEQPGSGDTIRWFAPRLGDESAYHWVVNRNKRSIALDLKDPRGVQVLHRLAAEADAVVEGFRPGVVDRLGVGYEALRAVNPRLVCCSISGYGSSGPRAQEAGHDLNYIGRAGLLSVTGVDGRPAIPGVQLADVAGGGLLGIVGLLAALLRAQRTGEGDHVEVSMTDGAFALLSVHLGEFFATGRPPQMERQLLTGRYPCYQLYECADGRWLTVAALEEPFWVELCNALGRPDLLPTRVDSGALPIWQELFGARERDAWLRDLEGLDVCVGPVNDFAEAVADGQLREREMVLELEHPLAGPTSQVGTPIKLRAAPAAVRTAAPRLGESTRDVLAAAGFGGAEIEGLLAAGVVAAA